MNKASRLHTLLGLACKVLYFLLPIPVAWLSLSLTARYWAYYDIGINTNANRGFLLFIVAPILLTALYITAGAGLYLANRFLTSKWLGMALGSFLIFTVGIGAFIFQVQSSADYPTEEPQNIEIFLKHYLTESR